MPNCKRNEIIYTGCFQFPEGDAAAARVLGIGKALRDIGYTVRFAGAETIGRAEDRQHDNSYAYQGFSYYPTGELRSRRASLLGRLLRYLSIGKRTLEYLCSIDIKKVSTIIVYNPFTSYHIRLGKFCREAGIALVADCTEWHDPAHYPGGHLGLHRWDIELSMRYLNVRLGKLITISSYLEHFYCVRGVNTVRIPPLVDLVDAKWSIKRMRPWDEQPVRLIYAGNPGRKEFLENILIALKTIQKEGISVVLEFLGPTKKSISSILGNRVSLLSDLENALIFRGFFKQSKVPYFLSQAHIGVLLRPHRKYAQAGFPTKIVEYMSAGLPVITNATSDIAEYVRDGVEGFILRNDSAEAFAEGIRRATKVGSMKLREMGLAARNQAEKYFDYRNHISKLSEFFSHL